MARLFWMLLVLSGCASIPKVQVIVVGPPRDTPILQVVGEPKQDYRPAPLAPPGNVNGWIAEINQ